MATSKEYLEFIMEQLSDLEDISYRYMIGEYIIYYKGKVIGGIYDNRLLLKPVKTAIEFIKTPIFDIPYNGAKEMLLISEVDDREYLAKLIKLIYNG